MIENKNRKNITTILSFLKRFRHRSVTNRSKPLLTLMDGFGRNGDGNVSKMK